MAITTFNKNINTIKNNLRVYLIHKGYPLYHTKVCTVTLSRNGMTKNLGVFTIRYYTYKHPFCGYVEWNNNYTIKRIFYLNFGDPEEDYINATIK